VKLGFYKAVITPPIGTPLAGYSGRKGGSIGVHDDLYARALYLSFGGEECLLLASDLLGIPLEIERRAEALIARRAGLRPGSIVLSSTHTHSGPDPTGEFSPGETSYVEELVEKLAGVSSAAKAHAADVEEVCVAVGGVEEVVVNRRKPGFGPIDPQLTVLSFYAAGKAYSLLNFTCHAVVMGHNNLYISRDYPGALVDLFEAYTGHNAVFLNGACGDINPLTPSTDLSRVYDRSVGTFEEVEWMGDVLAHEACRAHLLSRREPITEIAFKSGDLQLRLAEHPSLGELEEKLREAEERARREDSPEAWFEYYRAKFALVRLRAVEGSGWYPVRLSALRVNDAAVVFLPSEVFVELGLAVKRESPFRHTAVAGYSNDYFGYIPTSEAYSEGGYEATFPVTLLREGEGEKLAERALRLLDELS